MWGWEEFKSLRGEGLTKGQSKLLYVIIFEIMIVSLVYIYVKISHTTGLICSLLHLYYALIKILKSCKHVIVLFRTHGRPKFPLSFYFLNNSNDKDNYKREKHNQFEWVTVLVHICFWSYLMFCPWCTTHVLASRRRTSNLLVNVIASLSHENAAVIFIPLDMADLVHRWALTRLGPIRLLSGIFCYSNWDKLTYTGGRSYTMKNFLI